MRYRVIAPGGAKFGGAEVTPVTAGLHDTSPRRRPKNPPRIHQESSKDPSRARRQRLPIGRTGTAATPGPLPGHARRKETKMTEIAHFLPPATPDGLAELAPLLDAL